MYLKQIVGQPSCVSDLSTVDPFSNVMLGLYSLNEEDWF
jgi:hypothetical protein